MTVTPLASTTQMQEGPYSDLIRDYSTQALSDLMVQASRAVESMTNRRLIPFQITESQRLDATDIEDSIVAGMPLTNQAQMSLDYANALGFTELVRHAWVRETPPRLQEYWTGSIVACSIEWSFGGTITVDPSTIQFEPDTGHLRFALGTFAPPGSTGLITYTGGYTTTPEDLVRLTLALAADIAVGELDPSARPDMQLDGTIKRLARPWCQ